MTENPINGLRAVDEEALALLVGKREWPAFRAAALLATADLPPETTQLAAALLEAALEGLTPGHGAALDVDEAGLRLPDPAPGGPGTPGGGARHRGAKPGGVRR